MLVCLYTPLKQVQFGGGRIANIQKKWAEHVLNSDRILIVGVRPYEEDSHIWEPLSQTSATLGFIGSEDEFNKWKDKHRKARRDRFIGKYWSDHLSDGVEFLTGQTITTEK